MLKCGMKAFKQLLLNSFYTLLHQLLMLFPHIWQCEVELYLPDSAGCIHLSLDQQRCTFLITALLLCLFQLNGSSVGWTRNVDGCCGLLLEVCVHTCLLVGVCHCFWEAALVCKYVRACGSQRGQIRGCILPGTFEHGLGKRGPSTFWCVASSFMCCQSLGLDGQKYDRHKTLSASYFSSLCLYLPQCLPPELPCSLTLALSLFIQQQPHDFLSGSKSFWGFLGQLKLGVLQGRPVRKATRLEIQYSDTQPTKKSTHMSTHQSRVRLALRHSLHMKTSCLLCLSLHSRNTQEGPVWGTNTNCLCNHSETHLKSEVLKSLVLFVLLAITGKKQINWH